MLSLRHSLASGVIASLATLMPPGLPALGASPVDQVNVVNPATNPVPTTVLNPATNPVPTTVLNPPTSPVPTTVVNPADMPAFTSSVDDPGRIPFQQRIQSDCTGQNFCQFVSSRVPGNHRLVVQHVSGQIFSTSSSNPGTPLDVEVGAGAQSVDQTISFFAQSVLTSPGSGAAITLFAQPVLVYADPGAVVAIQINGPGFQNNFSNFERITLTGYLLDCTVSVSPCAPIAP